MLEDAALWFSAGNRSSRAGDRIGMVGISFAGGLSMVAAGRPSPRAAGWRSSSRSAATPTSSGWSGTCARATEPPAPGHRPARRAYRRRTTTAWRSSRSTSAEQLVPGGAGGAAEARHPDLPARVAPRAVRPEEGRARSSRKARAMEDALDEPARTFLHLVNRRDVADARAPPAAPHRQPRRRSRRCRPTSRPRPTRRCSCSTATRTTSSPRSNRCGSRSTCEPHTAVHVLLTPLISHAEVDRPATTREVIDLVAFWAGMSEALTADCKMRQSKA